MTEGACVVADNLEGIVWPPNKQTGSEHLKGNWIVLMFHQVSLTPSSGISTCRQSFSVRLAKPGMDVH